VGAQQEAAKNNRWPASTRKGIARKVPPSPSTHADNVASALMYRAVPCSRNLNTPCDPSQLTAQRAIIPPAILPYNGSFHSPHTLPGHVNDRLEDAILPYNGSFHSPHTLPGHVNDRLEDILPLTPHPSWTCERQARGHSPHTLPGHVNDRLEDTHPTPFLDM
jgi:hypothetical protein